MEEPRLLREWRSDWFCYWTGDYGLPADLDKDFVFKPALQQGEGGLVSSPLCSPASDAGEVGTTKEDLLALARKLQERGALCSEAGSESDYDWLPCLFALPEGERLTAESLLQALGAHQEIRSSARAYEPEEERLQQMFGDLTEEVFQLLKEKEGEGEQPLLMFHAGSEKLNPVPFFVLSRLADGLVGGFVSAVVHT